MNSVVAAGHPATARAAAQVLNLGGNACDAALAGMLAACVAEPCLASLGGGGFLLVAPANKAPRIYDFFCQTPNRKRLDETSFFPIEGNFGATTQRFHIGAGSIATPGVVPGLLAAHQTEGGLALSDIIRPAQELAVRGVTVNNFQAYILQVLRPILDSTPDAAALFSGGSKPRLAEGDTQSMPLFAEYLASLLTATTDNWWQHQVWIDVCEQIEAQGGHLSIADLASYQVEVREPFRVELGDASFITNPPPAMGGVLVAAGLLRLSTKTGFNSVGPADFLDAMQIMNRLREAPDSISKDLGTEFARQWRAAHGAQVAGRGTTHISVADAQGGLAGLTLSNGEGSGIVVPRSNIMLNNMLGEDDLQPKGLGHWVADQRLASMMAPSLVISPALGRVVLGSGGSNRIRSALLQVAARLLGGGVGIAAAIKQSRVHLEAETLYCEEPTEAGSEGMWREYAKQLRAFDGMNLFFGGVHAAGRDHRDQTMASADPRRGGVTVSGA